MGRTISVMLGVTSAETAAKSDTRRMAKRNGSGRSSIPQRSKQNSSSSTLDTLLGIAANQNLLPELSEKNWNIAPVLTVTQEVLAKSFVSLKISKQST